MNDERLAELQEKYKCRNLLVELYWGMYADHSGYTSKQNGEFLNWLCMRAYKALKERPHGVWAYDYTNGFGNKIGHCSECNYSCERYNYCPKCGADMRKKGMQ